MTPTRFAVERQPGRVDGGAGVPVVVEGAPAFPAPTDRPEEFDCRAGEVFEDRDDLDVGGFA